jgi:hypothetical protein
MMPLNKEWGYIALAAQVYRISSERRSISMAYWWTHNL